MDLLTRRIEAKDIFSNVDCVRIESPGENDEVTGRLIALGARLGGVDWGESCPPPEHGRIWYGGQWAAGFLATVKEFGEKLTFPRVWMNSPGAIALATDKVMTCRQLSDQRLATTRSLGFVTQFEQLLWVLRHQRVSRVFIKPRHGSSASGVVAFQSGRNRMLAITTTEMVEANGELRLYNSLRVRRYENPAEIAKLINALGQHDMLHVERWMPKLSWQGRPFDLRVLTIAGKARHAVMRLGNGPITNLHLGGARGDLEAWQREHPSLWQTVVERVEQAARIFTGDAYALYIGWDVLVSSDRRQVAIVEANAFGDLLPGVLSDNQTSYEAECWTFLEQTKRGR
jgi:hypothetical protein